MQRLCFIWRNSPRKLRLIEETKFFSHGGKIRTSRVEIHEIHSDLVMWNGVEVCRFPPHDSNNWTTSRSAMQNAQKTLLNFISLPFFISGLMLETNKWERIILNPPRLALFQSSFVTWGIFYLLQYCALLHLESIFGFLKASFYNLWFSCFWKYSSLNSWIVRKILITQCSRVNEDRTIDITSNWITHFNNQVK